MARFNKEKISIPNCNSDIAIRAFVKGLLPGSDLYADLIKYEPKTMEESLSRAFAQARWEEVDKWVPRDTMANQRGGSGQRGDRGDQRTNDRNRPCYAPYNRIPHARAEANQTNSVRAELRPDRPAMI